MAATLAALPTVLANRLASHTLDSAPATKATAPPVQWSTIKVVVKAGSYEPVLKRIVPALYKAAKQLLAIASSAEQVAALCSVLMSSSGHKPKLDRALARLPGCRAQGCQGCQGRGAGAAAEASAA